MQIENTEIIYEYAAAIEAVRKLAAKLHGFCSYLAEEGRRLVERGDQVTGKQYLVRAAALTATKLASPGVSHPEIIEAANDWSRRAVGLRKGPAS